ncbi:transglycosylase [Clostridiales bacterium KA00134]|nr:transglycosylase [Clostridiales bacterium KA00134]
MKKSKKRKKNHFKFSNFITIIFLLGIIIFTALGGLLGTYILSVLKDAPSIDPQNFRDRIIQTSKIFTEKGELLESLVQSEFSEYVTSDKIPKYLKDAVVAIEDERFYDHSAVDFRRVLGAMVENLKAKRFKEGASTITMQLSKNLYTSKQVDMTRKLTDVYYSFQIENALSKDQILEAYLNSAAFSKGTVGVQAAAKTFFNKNVWDLSLAESALIAGVTNLPEKYTPYNTAEIDPSDDLANIQLVLLPMQNINVDDRLLQIAARLREIGKIDGFEEFQIKNGHVYPMKAIFNPTSKKRQERILDKMLAQGKISKDEHDTAKAAPIILNIGRRKASGISSYYTDIVKDESLKILADLGYSKEEAHQKLYNGGLNIYTAMDINIQKSMEDTVNKISLRGEKINENGELQPQLGSVIIEQATGKVRGVIGGRRVGGGRIANRAIIPRQPGSSIKPISVYLTAFNNKATAGDIYADESLQGVNLPYLGFTPKNVGSYRGWQSIRQLLVRSSNVGSYLVARDISANLDSKQNKYSKYSKVVNDDENFKKMVTTLEELGVDSVVKPEDDIRTNDYNYAALTLGGMTYGISPLKMASAYSAFPNEGKLVKPIFVTKIESSDGKEIYKAEHKETRVTSDQIAYIMNDILKEVVTKSTGRKAQIKKMTVAGKTGTTNSKQEAWFVGYTPYYTCSVFIGNDNHDSLKFSSDVAAGVFSQIMSPIHEGLEDKDFFEKPDGINRKYISALGYTELIPEGLTPRNQQKPSYFAPEEDEDDDDKTDSDSDNSRRKRTDDNENNSSSSKRRKRADDENNSSSNKRRSRKDDKDSDSKSKNSSRSKKSRKKSSDYEVGGSSKE